MMAPLIDVSLSFSPTTHSFTQPTPPTLTITLTSRAETQITLFTFKSAFDISAALLNETISIKDKSTGQYVQTATVRVNRGPLKRTRRSRDEEYFVTLLPGLDVEVKGAFGRRNGTVKPDPKSIVQRGWELDENGNERKIRRSTLATGVDGLEPGHEYIISLVESALDKIWWTPVDREEVLVDGNDEGSYVQDYAWEKTPLEWRVQGAELKVEE